jgi:hypothetical protein
MTRDEMLATRTGAWSDQERAAMADIVAALRPSPRHLADVFDWLDDLAARDGVRAASVLAEPKLRAALASSGSPPDRLKRWKEALRRLRYPRLVARESDFAAAVRALELGRGVTITAPEALEGGTITIAIRVASAVEIEASLARLVRVRADLARLFALLE